MSVLSGPRSFRSIAHLLQLLFGIVIALATASLADACGNCAACRLAQACDGTAAASGDAVSQSLLGLGGSGSDGGSGGDALPIAPGSWTLALMPDTQHYTDNPANFFHFSAQTNWLATHKVSHNVKYVLHQGDIVNNNIVSQWNFAKTAFTTLDNADVPYSLAPGNHDYGTNGSSNNRTTLFHNTEYFGPTSPYAMQSSIGGFYEAGKTDNSWHTFNAGGHDWLVLNLEFGPRDAVVAWANSVVAANPDKLAILNTHAYMYNDDTIYDWDAKGGSQSWNPRDAASYGINSLAGGVNDGQDLWDNLVKLHENFRFVFNGHVLGDGTGYRATQGVYGNTVHQILANYQFNAQGGQGDMRLLEFLADGETVIVRTYSPSLDRYDTASDQQFQLSLPPTEPLVAMVDRNNGEIVLRNDSDVPIVFDSYQLDSLSQSLNVTGWNSLDDQNFQSVGGGVGQSWVEAGGSSSAAIAEAFFLGFSTLAPNTSISLGEAYNYSVDGEDLIFRYRSAGSGNIFTSDVQYINQPPTGAFGDYNDDGVVNIADFTVWRDKLGSNSTMANDKTLGSVTSSDYGVWRSNFGANGGAGSSTAIPEPSTYALLLMAGVVAWVARKQQVI